MLWSVNGTAKCIPVILFLPVYFFLISSWLGQDFYIITRPKSYFPYLPYLPFGAYFPGRNIPANSTGKYRGWNLPLNLAEYAFDEEATIILDEMLDEPITGSEIRAFVMNLKNGKSPGIDGIPTEFFKVACDKFLPFLEILFNKLYNSSYFPNDWSISIITPIPKKGDKIYLIIIEGLVYSLL